MKQISNGMAFCIAIFLFLGSLSVYSQNTVTELVRSGPTGVKKDLIFIGDGFQAGNGQTAFNNWVNTIVQNLFGFDTFFNEDMNAFNIYRINAVSQDSGVTQLSANGQCPSCGQTQPWGTTDTTYPYNDTCQNCGTPMQVIVTVARNTALDYRYSGVWGRCWMEAGPNFNTNFNNIVGALVPQYDMAIIVLNEAGGGGCGGGGKSFLTLSTGWQVVAHEMGHAVGGLTDEYFNAGNYAGGEPGAKNATINLNPLKWNEFVDPNTAIPTVLTPGMDPNQDVGAFQGAVYCSNGIYRPCSICTMRNNTPTYCPVCYNHMKNTLDTAHDYTYQNSYRGDFDGDGLMDLLLHNANSITIYRSTGTRLEAMWRVTGDLSGWDDVMPGDKFFIGDFNNDGRDDAYVFNIDDWKYPYFGLLRSDGANGLVCIKLYELELPGWDDMKKNDKFFVSDFNGDGRDDIVVFNGHDWAVGYLELLSSDGTKLNYVKRYDEELPGWDDMKKNDKFYIADFDADGKDDIYVFNGHEWDVCYLEMLKSTGNKLKYIKRYDEELPGWDDMKKNDKFYVGDLNEDNKDDIYVFNGHDWSDEYLGMLRSTGNKLQMVRVYEDKIPGWGKMAPNDEFYVGDINGDGKDDLYAYNSEDWKTEYLGLLKVVNDNSLNGTYYEDWVGNWNLGTPDKFIVTDFDNDDDEGLFIRNDNWFGILRSNGNSLDLIKMYPNWIHNLRYHKNGWW